MLRGHTQHSWPPPSAEAQGPASLHTQAPPPPEPPLLISEPALPRSLIWQRIPNGLVVGPQLFVFSISIKLPPRLMSYLLLDYKNSYHHSHGMEYRTRSKKLLIKQMLKKRQPKALAGQKQPLLNSGITRNYADSILGINSHMHTST